MLVVRLTIKAVLALTVVLGLYIALWAAAASGQEAAKAVTEEMALGSPDAPITIIEYASLTCPHCATFHQEVLGELKERYIAPGKVRLVYRDFPLDAPAVQAAVVARCAGPERYFGFLDVLFRTQARWSRAEDPAAELKRIARLGGLSEEEVEQCLQNEALTNAVLQNRLQGQQEFEINSTPTFIIGGKAYQGSRSVEEFAEIIEPLL
jgi:protein-disulfide isomerase